MQTAQNKAKHSKLHIFVINGAKAVHITGDKLQVTVDEVCDALSSIVGLIRGTYVLSCQRRFLSGSEILRGPIILLDIHFLIINLSADASTPVAEYMPSNKLLIKFPSSSKSFGPGAEN